MRSFLFPSILLLVVTPAVAENPAPEWAPVTIETGKTTEAAALLDLTYDYPDSASAKLKLVNALYDEGGDSFGGQAMALATRGYALSEAGEAAVTARLDLDYAAIFGAKMAENRRAIEASSLIATLPEEARLVEGVARDPQTGDLYATTVVSRALYRKHGDGPWEKIELEGAGGLSGIAYDPMRKLFWIASGVFEETPGEPVYSAALGFDPAEGKVVRKLYANGMVPLGDIAVGADGTVYAANPLAAEIHMANPDVDEGFHALVGQGIFRSPQGMVPVPGTDLLIISDYAFGLAALDIKKGKLWRVTGGNGEFLDGIDALQLYGRSLIAVQNGHRPMRILKLDMAKDWLSIDRITVLESNHSRWTEPVGGTVDGKELLYVGTGQWDRFGKGGEVKEGAAPGPTEVRSLPLGD